MWTFIYLRVGNYLFFCCHVDVVLAVLVISAGLSQVDAGV